MAGAQSGLESPRPGCSTAPSMHSSQHAQLQPGTGKVSAEPQFRLLLHPQCLRAAPRPSPSPGVLAAGHKERVS